jgi:hypothetical protein
LLSWFSSKISSSLLSSDEVLLLITISSLLIKLISLFKHDIYSSSSVSFKLSLCCNPIFILLLFWFWIWFTFLFLSFFCFYSSEYLIWKQLSAILYLLLFYLFLIWVNFNYFFYLVLFYWFFGDNIFILFFYPLFNITINYYFIIIL